MTDHCPLILFFLRIRFILVPLLLLLIVSCDTTKRTSITSQVADKAYQFHTVIKGETIDKIANSYNISQEEIKNLNPGLDFKKLKEGFELKIPKVKQVAIEEKKEEKKETLQQGKSTLTKMALILPFNALAYAENSLHDQEVVTIDPLAIPAIHFYQGLQMALDSLASSGNSFELTLFDSWMDSSALIKLVRDSIFSKNDLVISGASTNWLQQLTLASLQSKTPLVVLQNNSASFLEGNHLLYLASPSVAQQCLMMSEFLYRKYGKENLILLHQDTKRENDLASLFSSGFETSRLRFGENDTLKMRNLIYSGKLFEKGNKLFDKTLKNVILIPSSDEAFVSPIISRLDSLKEFKFIFCGLPTWENFESIDPRKFQNLQTHIFSSTYIDYTREAVIQFRKKFISKYKSDPLYNAYLGFSIGYLAGSVLEKNKVHSFERELEKSDSHAYPVILRFQSKSKEDGKENHQMSILKFEDFSLKKIE